MSGRPVSIRGLPPGAGNGEIASAIRDIALGAAGGLSWLSPGETVLLKPALNSGDPYPSTTHPLAVSVLAELLHGRGARVVIGDQSGIEHVLQGPSGVIHGSTADNYARSGMGSRDDPRFVAFEEGHWDRDFVHHRSACTGSWGDGFSVTSWVKRADHVISLPRVSTHSIAGVTLGFKNMVGLLREDSRMAFHANGPMTRSILRSARGSTLRSSDDGTGTFFEKIVEISDALRGKLRLTLFVATAVQATFGPDRYGIRMGQTGLGRSYIVYPEPGLVFGSADPVAAEATALAVLKDATRALPRAERYLQRIGLFGNPYVSYLHRLGIRDHPFIRHAMYIGLGEMPGEVIFENVPETCRHRLLHLIHGD
jgi:hypothetical protein